MKPVTIISLVSAGYVFISLLSIGLLSSCSKEDQEDLTATGQQKWKLVKMSTTISETPKETTGKDMIWQEYFIFNSDNTFVKSREQDGQVKEASGSYSIIDKKWMKLTYKSGVELKASCFDHDDLQIISDEKIINSSWGICDGPLLEYKLVKQVGKD